MSNRAPLIAAKSRSFIVRPLALAALMASGGAFAQGAGGSPWNIGVSQGFGHQTNLFGATDSETRIPDKYSITSLFGGVDLRLSRQRLYANGVVRANRYEDIDLLNNNAYGFNVGLDWETVNNLTGTLRTSGNRSLASYTTPGAPDIGQEKNIETSNQVLANIRYGITSRFAVTAGWQRRDVDFSAAAFRTGEFTQNEVSAGVRYGLPSLMVFGLGLRNSKTDRPQQFGTGGGNEIDRNDIDLTFDWSPTGLSTLNARLSYGKEDNSRPGVADFKGTTGELGWMYRPTGKTSFNLSLSRDTGTSSSFGDYAGDASSLETYSSRLTNRVAAGVNYNPTAKIQLNAGVRHAKADIDGTGGSGDETTRGATLGARYAYSRSIAFNCGVSHEKRDALGSSDISNRTVNCTGQLTLR